MSTLASKLFRAALRGRLALANLLGNGPRKKFESGLPSEAQFGEGLIPFFHAVPTVSPTYTLSVEESSQEQYESSSAVESKYEGAQKGGKGSSVLAHASGRAGAMMPTCSSQPQPKRRGSGFG
jgi:hypothetical protein